MPISPSSAALTEADLASFARLGIGAALLKKAGVVRVTDDEARSKYGINGHGDRAGIIFPYFSRHDGHRVGARLRRDNPEVENGKPKNKYISAYGDRKHLYFVPGSESDLNNKDIPVVLVEAEKSVLALAALSERTGYKMVPVGLGGCWGWRGRIGRVVSIDGGRADEVGMIDDLQLCRENRHARQKCRHQLRC